ncbi:hypothetical protein IGM_04331 [Bacillus cereus HuB4-4]|uniref:Uncharacterized protein n=1 Tax=Bacillus cereus HuB4-4 TaxID=1053211 RepID=A0A9W5VKE7_BACCE|nr:hypothetical protein [Bacillus cereus]EOP85956.1 hypothetical protein IGM_04331 [Bacillus cereus HuB4-4]
MNNPSYTMLSIMGSIGAWGIIITFCGIILSLFSNKIRPFKKRMIFTFIASIILLSIGELNYKIDKISMEQKQKMIKKASVKSERALKKEQAKEITS